MELKISAALENYDRPTDQPTGGRQTNRPGHREVSLPINKDGKGDMNEGIKVKEDKKVV